MTFWEFKASLLDNQPPAQSGNLLQALWHDARGDWSAAHQIAQDIDTATGARVHAYLHRKEGDESNAQYWYHKAKQTMPNTSLEEEWEVLVKSMMI